MTSITGIFMYTEDEDYEFKIREINESCVRELKNDATNRHAKQKRKQRPETGGHLRDLEACSLLCYVRQDPFQRTCLERRTAAHCGLTEGLLKGEP